jgi:hypothetical protein
MHNYVTISQDDEIRKLKDDLYTARCTVIEILGEEIERVLFSYLSGMKEGEFEYQNTSSGLASRWLRSIVDDVLKLANAKPTYDGDRARCPLCGGSSQAPYAAGFAFPEGLRRHLLGEYNSNMCVVMTIAGELAQEYAEKRNG